MIDLERIAYNESGLIPVIAQAHDTGIVLMLAWMNAQALAETLATRRVCYFSRSRNKLWRKGETSGHVQHLISAHLDCDADALLLKVRQEGPACHTGEISCFFRLLELPLVADGSSPHESKSKPII